MTSSNSIPNHEFTLTTSDGLKLYARSWGEPQASRAAVVLVHGLVEHCGRDEHVVKALAATGRCMLGFR